MKKNFLSGEAGKTISEFLFNYSKEKNIYMRTNYVNAEHIHSIIDLPSNRTVEECLKLIKAHHRIILMRAR